MKHIFNNGLLVECLLVSVAGIAFALLANLASPRGVGLTQNYFPASQPGRPPATHKTRTAGNASQSNNIPTASPMSAAAIRLKKKGLQLMDGVKVAQLFHDPRRQQGMIVFVDARDDRHYQAGHIPGAIQFDHYHPEKYLLAVLSACQPADQVVVYCNGGDCEDSEFAALILRDAGIPSGNLFVFAGGITEWTANHHPVEVGAQNSGELQPAGGAP